MRAREVAAALGIAKSTLYNWIGAGQFPAPIHVGEKCSRWRRSEVDAWIDSLPRRAVE